MKPIEDTCNGCGNTYQRLPHAKSGLCCSCRRIKRESRVRTDNRTAPDPLAFDSQAALDAWYSADALRCHICGDSFPGLYRHVGMAHGISVRDYKIRYGIPMGYGLSGRATRMKQRACGAATSTKNRESGFDNLEKAREAKRNGETRTAWVRYQAAEHGVRISESPNPPSRYEGMTEMTCTSCGNHFDMPASIALAFQCRAKCPDCLTASPSDPRRSSAFSLAGPEPSR